MLFSYKAYYNTCPLPTGEGGGNIPKFVYADVEYEFTDEEMEVFREAAELYEKNKDAVLADVNMSDLVDLKDINIDTSKPTIFRMASFIKQIRYPYLYKVGDVKIQVRYADTDRTLTDNFVEMFNRRFG